MDESKYFNIRKRWEGKPFQFKLRYFIANFPEIALGGIILFVMCPVAAFYKSYTYSGGVNETVRKFKSTYIVVREDHPDIEAIRAEKESGKHNFPKY